MALGIVLVVSLIKINLSQESGSGSLGGTTLVSLCCWQDFVGILQIVDDLLPALVIRVLGILQIVIVILCHIKLVDKRNLLEQTLQLEVSVGTQELHLGRTLLDGCIALVGSSQNVKRQADTREIVVQLSPDRAEVPVGS